MNSGVKELKGYLCNRYSVTCYYRPRSPFMIYEFLRPEDSRGGSQRNAHDLRREKRIKPG